MVNGSQLQGRITLTLRQWHPAVNLSCRIVNSEAEWVATSAPSNVHKGRRFSWLGSTHRMTGIFSNTKSISKTWCLKWRIKSISNALKLLRSNKYAALPAGRFHHALACRPRLFSWRPRQDADTDFPRSRRNTHPAIFSKNSSG